MGTVSSVQYKSKTVFNVNKKKVKNSCKDNVEEKNIGFKCIPFEVFCLQLLFTEHTIILEQCLNTI